MKKSLLGLMLGTSVLIAAPALGQSAEDLQEAVRNAPDGKVQMVFTARPEVWGDGDRNSWVQRSRSLNPRCTCTNGPVRVTLQVRSGTVHSISKRVGGAPRRESDHDLGRVPAPSAASYLMNLARELNSSETANEALDAAVLADSARLWPDLLTIAKDVSRPSRVRKTAVFWLSQEAGEEAAPVLEELAAEEDEDLEVREQAIFALSQLPDGRGVPHLLRVAREQHNPRIIRKAFFWLGQTDDPRALALFEEVLTSGG